jgi:hypothetical protein
MYTHYKKKGRDRLQKEKYLKLHHKIALILQKHPEGLYRSEIQAIIDAERRKEKNTEKLTLVTLRKHLNDFIQNENLVIETDINPSDSSRMARRKLFWAFQHEGIRIINDVLLHWLSELQKDYNEYVEERKGNTTVTLSQVKDYFLTYSALFFIPLTYKRSDGKAVHSYFLYSVMLENMNKDPEKVWKEAYEKSLKATQYLKDNPRRKFPSSLRFEE